MINVRTYSAEELVARRRGILDQFGMTLDEFRQRAETYSLRGREYDAWDDLSDIEFLLGES
ncbi:hypothetical protein SKPI104516_06460 [Skermania piniformis]